VGETKTAWEAVLGICRGGKGPQGRASGRERVTRWEEVALIKRSEPLPVPGITLLLRSVQAVFFAVQPGGLPESSRGLSLRYPRTTDPKAPRTPEAVPLRQLVIEDNRVRQRRATSGLPSRTAIGNGRFPPSVYSCIPWFNSPVFCDVSCPFVAINSPSSSSSLMQQSLAGGHCERLGAAQHVELSEK